MGKESSMRASSSVRITLAVLLLTAAAVSVGCSESSPTAATVVESDYRSADSSEVVIMISPATLVIDSAGTTFTVHAEIPYSTVDTATVSLDGLVPAYCKADARGDLVVKFERGDVVAIVSPPEATMTLSGLTVDAVPFSGSDTIVVQ
jgi:hypothetical protein